MAALVDLPGVRDAVDEARAACTELRWHTALRRRIPEAAAESRVRGARSSALLDGADVPLEQVRLLVAGAQPWLEHPDPVLRTLRAAVQATAEAEHVQTQVARAPLQALARLHVAAGSPLLEADELGRPRTGAGSPGELVELGEAVPAEQVPARLARIGRLARSAGGDVPVLVVAALVHAEIALVRPFPYANGLVARAVERALVVQGGLDPTGVAVPETGHHAGGQAEYLGALAAYAGGTPDGLALWLTHCARAITLGAREGGRIADAVLAGRVTPARG